MDTHYHHPSMYKALCILSMLYLTHIICMQVYIVYAFVYVVLLRSDTRSDTSLMYTPRPSTQPKVYSKTIHTCPYNRTSRWSVAVAALLILYLTLTVPVRMFLCHSMYALLCMLERPRTSSSQSRKAARDSKSKPIIVQTHLQPFSIVLQPAIQIGPLHPHHYHHKKVPL